MEFETPTIYPLQCRNAALDFQDGTDLDKTASFKDRTAHRKLGRRNEIVGLYERIAADDVLGFSVGTVGDGFFLSSLDHFTRVIEGMPHVFEMAFLLKLF